MTTRLTSKFEALRALAKSRKLRDPEYRHAMIDAEIRHGLSDQIRSMRARRGWSQKDLAGRMGTSQPAVARLEASREKYVSFPTLLAVAKAFDTALLVRFVPFSELVRRSFDGSEHEQAPLSFAEEVAYVSEHRIPAPAATTSRFSTQPAAKDSITSRVNQAPVSTGRYEPAA